MATLKLSSSHSFVSIYHKKCVYRKAFTTDSSQQTIVFVITNWCLTWNISLPEYICSGLWWRKSSASIKVQKWQILALRENISTLINHVRVIIWTEHFYILRFWCNRGSSVNKGTRHHKLLRSPTYLWYLKWIFKCICWPSFLTYLGK